MKVREVMRPAWGLGAESGLDEVGEAIQATGCEAVPIVAGSNGDLRVVQMVSLSDLPKLRRVAVSGERGHAVGGTVLELLSALGRRPGRFPTIGPDATLVDAWSLMSDEAVTTITVVDAGGVIGVVSLVVTFAEFPHRSPTAGFWP